MLRVTPVSCLKDNYAYLVENSANGEVLIVDASEAAPVVSALERLGVQPVWLLSTHHHHDHVGGNLELARRYSALRIFAHPRERARVPGQTDGWDDGEERSWGDVVVRGFHVPGHTLGAVAYQVGSVLFTGDTLFHAGCGRLFEGTAEMLFASLGRLARLEPTLRVYPGHEYTLDNLRFAGTVEPENRAARARLEQVRGQRARGEPTVGGTLGEELDTNPFLRCSQRTLRGAVGLDDRAPPARVFAALRRAKDVFRAF